MVTKTKSPKRKEPNAAQIRAWLKSHGHDPQDVDALDLSTKEKAKESIVDLHGKKAKK